MMPILPKITIRPTVPTFYNKDAVTMLELAGKIHGVVNEIITDYNNFSEQVNKQIATFTQETSEGYETFKTSLRQEFQDFIDAVTLEYKGMYEAVDDAVKTSLQKAKDSGEFDGAPGKSAFDYAVEKGFSESEERFSQYLGGLGVKEFNLSEMGMDNLTTDGTTVTLETDTTEILKALDRGSIRFVFNVEYNGLAFSNMKMTFMQSGSNENQLVTGSMQFGKALFFFTFTIVEGSISAFAREFTLMLDSYMEEALGGDF